jgi:hypothetical protein
MPIRLSLSLTDDDREGVQLQLDLFWPAMTGIKNEFDMNYNLFV